VKPFESCEIKDSGQLVMNQMLTRGKVAPLPDMDTMGQVDDHLVTPFVNVDATNLTAPVVEKEHTFGELLKAFSRELLVKIKSYTETFHLKNNCPVKHELHGELYIQKCQNCRKVF
jgi:hypothetical protein